MVLLRDVRRLFAERLNFLFFIIDLDTTFYSVDPVEEINNAWQQESRTAWYKNGINFYFKPANIFIKEVFPAPDGPRIAVSCPGSKAPLIWFKIRLIFLPSNSIVKIRLFHSLSSHDSLSAPIKHYPMNNRSGLFWQHLYTDSAQCLVLINNLQSFTHSYNNISNYACII